MKYKKEFILQSQKEMNEITNPSCFWDSANGTYQGIYVQELAQRLGKKGRVIKQSNENFCEYWIEAENYINQFVRDGLYFGQDDNGDCGIWKIEED